jgi:hypothetical protein
VLERLARALASRRVSVFVAIAAFVLALPTLSSGFVLDDYYLRLCRDPTRAAPEDLRAPWDMFHFQLGGPAFVRHEQEIGVAPWWTAPDFRLAFLRPLSSLTHAFDFAFFPDRAPVMHLENALLYAALSFIVARLFRTVVGATWSAGLAALMYAASDKNAIPLVWISNRNALLAGVFGFGAVLAHVRGREADRNTPTNGAGRAINVASVVLVILALASGEAALAPLAYIPAYALTLDDAPSRARVRSLLPIALVVAGWLALYHALGYGTHGGDFYVDPVDRPLAFAGALATHAPTLLLGQFALPPADLGILLPRPMMLRFAAIAAAICGAGGVLFARVLRRDRVARFFVVGLFFALVPVCATAPNDRLLLGASFGAFGLIALFFAKVGETAGVLRWVAGAGALFLFLRHVVLAPPLLPVRAVASARAFQRPAELAAATMPADPGVKDATLVVLNAPYVLVPSYALAVLVETGRGVPPRRLRTLGIDVRGTMTVERPSDREIVLSYEEPFPQESFSRVYRSSANPFSVGDETQLAPVTVRIEAVDPAGGATRISFRFETALEDSSLRWVVWDGNGFVPYRPPPVGAREVRAPVDITGAPTEPGSAK